MGDGRERQPPLVLGKTGLIDSVVDRERVKKLIEDTMTAMEYRATFRLDQEKRMSLKRTSLPITTPLVYNSFNINSKETCPMHNYLLYTAPCYLAKILNMLVIGLFSSQEMPQASKRRIKDEGKRQSRHAALPRCSG